MARWTFALVLSGLLFGGAGIALGRASDRALPVASLAECAVVSLPEPSTLPSTTTELVVSEPSVAPMPVVDDEHPAEPGEPRVRRLVVTSGIEGHEPIEALDEVRVGSGPVYAFVEAANGGGATELEVTFEREGGPTTGHVELEIPAHTRRHRTWAFTRGVREEGLWFAVVRDSSGVELARQPFDVIAAE